jgi:hypothetical protein
MFVLPNLSPLGPKTESPSTNYLNDEEFRKIKISDFVKGNESIVSISKPATSKFSFQYDKTDKDETRKLTMKCELMSGGFHFYVQEDNVSSPNKHDRHVNSTDFAKSATETLEQLLSKMYSAWETEQQ